MPQEIQVPAYYPVYCPLLITNKSGMPNTSRSFHLIGMEFFPGVYGFLYATFSRVRSKYECGGASTTRFDEDRSRPPQLHISPQRSALLL
ncbi:hypothetical protein AHF37_02604 [Paragonimus kellicotti]|nr:hypothetical protein AHF37_02604 [Paragonimus kellicotti]